LDIIWNLGIGIWDFIPYPEKKLDSAESAGADVNITLWLAQLELDSPV